MATQAKTANQIIQQAPAEIQPVLKEMFGDWSSLLNQTDRDLSSLFSPLAASQQIEQLLALEEVLKATDSFDAVANKLQERIETAKSLRTKFLAKVFDKLRPIEKTYRQLYMFFENALSTTGVQRPADLHVLDADPSTMVDPGLSLALDSVQKFLHTRNDSFNFRLTICNLVVPVFLNQEMRTKLEDICDKEGVLLISTLRDEQSVKAVLDAFENENDEYQFLSRPQTRAAAHVVTCGYLMNRVNHDFETATDVKDEGLYVPASMAFAGAIVRTDNSAGLGQAPVGTRFGEIKGGLKSRVEPGITDTGKLARQRQVIPVIRSGDNALCFFGCRSLAQDDYGPYKFFTSFRILRSVERMVRHYLLQIAFTRYSNDDIDEFVEKPLRRELQKLEADGTIIGFRLDIPRQWAMLQQGICPINLEIQPAGPIETFKLNIEAAGADFQTAGAR